MPLVYNERTGEFDDIPSPPIIRSFMLTSSPSIYLNDEITLHWEVDGANHIYIDNEEVQCNSKTITASSIGRQVIKLKATNADGISNRELEFVVNAYPQFNISATPTIIHKGMNENVVVRWNIQNVLNVKYYFNQDCREIPADGEMIISPIEDVNLTFEVTGIDGSRTFHHFVPIKVRDAARIKFKASRLFSYPNLPINLSWNIENAKSVSIDNLGTQPLHGSIQVNPGVDTTYVMRVVDDFGEKQNSLCIRMLPLPSIKELWVPAPKIEQDFSIKYIPPKFNVNINIPQINKPLVKLNLQSVPELKSSLFYVSDRTEKYIKKMNPFKSLYEYFFNK